MRTRWAALGAAVAVSLGGGVVMVANAASVKSANFTAIDPCRLIDTRGIGQNSDSTKGPLVDYEWDDELIGKETRVLTIAAETATVTKLGGCQIDPTDVDSVVMNVTVTRGSASSFLAIWPSSGTKPDPLVSSINWVAGQTIANAVTVTVGTSDQVKIYNDAGSVEVIVDIVGYFGA